MHEKLRGETEDAAVHGFGDDGMIAGAEETENGVNGGHSRSENVSALPAFEFSDGALESFAIGMIGARVVVAFVLAQFGLHVGGGLIDRRNDGAGGGIRLLPDVNRVGGKTHGGLLLPMTAACVARSDVRNLGA